MNLLKKVHEILISIDSYDNQTVAGKLRFGYLERELHFFSLVQMLLLIEKWFENSEYPEETEKCKSFAVPDVAQSNAQQLSSVTSESLHGALAMFELKILFHQNTSWQGMIIWVEGKQEQSFRSVLELIHLLDSALIQEEALKNSTNIKDIRNH